MGERRELLVFWIISFASGLAIHESAAEFSSHPFAVRFRRQEHGMLLAAPPERPRPTQVSYSVHMPREGYRRPVQRAIAPSGPVHAHTWSRGSAAPPKTSRHIHHHNLKSIHIHHFQAPSYGHHAAIAPAEYHYRRQFSPLAAPELLPVVSPSQHIGHTLHPVVSPSKGFAKKPRSSSISVLSPPPLSEDCSSISCTEPLTYTPAGYPCGCVWPIQVKLRLGVPLYVFFPLVSNLADEIRASLSLKKGQVRIVGAIAASQEHLQKTDVLVHLVPTQVKFRYAAAFVAYEKFWHNQVHLNSSLYGEYRVMCVKYPGLPPSPSANPNLGAMDDQDNHTHPVNGNLLKPLGVAIPRMQKNGQDKGTILVIILSAITAFAVCAGLAWLLVVKCRSSWHQTERTPSMQSLTKPSGATATCDFRSKSSFGTLSVDSAILTFTGSAKIFSLLEIEKATNGFDRSSVLGEGGFGLVYSGVLDDGKMVAVKVLKRDDRQGDREFLAEVEMLSRLHHRHLVKLIGICREDHCRCLVYELVPNGSVESYLHGVDKDVVPLDWGTRMKIALGAARGLAYLHEDSNPCVIHRDFKSSNILLQDDFTPKVSDFGLARSALNDTTPQISSHVMGTFGYLAPEYAMTGHLLVKSDVYSYGVVLLELLTGRKPVDFSQPPGQENLVAWALPHLTRQERLEAIMDASIKQTVPLDSFAKVAAIASMCVQPEVSRRPFMGEVVQALKLVCNEFELVADTANEEEDGCTSFKREHLSFDLESKGSEVSGSFFESYHILGYDSNSYDRKVALSTTDLMSAPVGFDDEEHHCRRKFSSGPLPAGKRRFWNKSLRGFSRGRVT